MVDLLGAGLAWLTQQFTAYASQTVTYDDGTGTIVVQATLGKKLLKLEDSQGGIRMEWTDLDLLIPSAALVINGNPVTPARGHRISIVQGDTLQIYEVMPYGSEPAWRWCDPGQTMYRIHAKYIDTIAGYY